MQNHYVGDVGDFGKYGLLRGIFQKIPACKLGIIWYLVSNGYGDRKNGSNDGRYIQYLDEEHKDRFQECDSELFYGLADIVGKKKRNVAEIENSHLFNESTVFYGNKLDYEKLGETKRRQSRENWLNDAVGRISNCNTVFLDPDNGLEVPSVGQYELKGPKYIYYDDLKRFVNKSRTLVIYQHLSRRNKHDEQIYDRTIQLKKAYPKFVVWALRFWPYSPRAFFILVNDEHRHDIKDRIEAFMRSSWERHFDSYFDGIKCIY